MFLEGTFPNVAERFKILTLMFKAASVHIRNEASPRHADSNGLKIRKIEAVEAEL